MTPEGFSWQENGGVRVLAPDFLRGLSLHGGYSTRASLSESDLDCDYRGSKPAEVITANRALAASAMGIEASRLVVAEQIHGAAVATVTATEAGRGAVSSVDSIRSADGLVTACAGIPLAILSADCAVILLADEGRRAVAAVHSGRKGTLANIASAAVGVISSLGIAPGSLFASIGPSICAECYEVGGEIAAEFEAAFPWAGRFLRISSGRTRLDLPGIIERELVEAGLCPERVYACRLCTACRNDLFFSYRKERASAGRCIGAVEIPANGA